MQYSFITFVINKQNDKNLFTSSVFMDKTVHCMLCIIIIIIIIIIILIKQYL